MHQFKRINSNYYKNEIETWLQAPIRRDFELTFFERFFKRNRWNAATENKFQQATLNKQRAEQNKRETKQQI